MSKNPPIMRFIPLYDLPDYSIADLNSMYEYFKNVRKEELLGLCIQFQIHPITVKNFIEIISIKRHQRTRIREMAIPKENNQVILVEDSPPKTRKCPEDENFQVETKNELPNNQKLPGISVFASDQYPGPSKVQILDGGQVATQEEGESDEWD